MDISWIIKLYNYKNKDITKIVYLYGCIFLLKINKYNIKLYRITDRFRYLDIYGSDSCLSIFISIFLINMDTDIDISRIFKFLSISILR